MTARLPFATNWQLMLGLVDRVQGLGLEGLPFIGDAGYGDVAELRRELNDHQRPDLLAVMSTTAVWAPGTGPQHPEGPMGKMLVMLMRPWQLMSLRAAGPISKLIASWEAQMQRLLLPPRPSHRSYTRAVKIKMSNYDRKRPFIVAERA